MSAYPDWVTLREIDARANAGKGTAFRAFKRIAGQFSEGGDYRVLHAIGDAPDIAAMRRDGRIYGNSVNIVILSPAMAQRLARELGAGNAPPAG